ncbi:unnamed protein product [Parascedosporium putredinis]|uniref:DNA-(apurinic or apyrimidinic site) lyase n=1 Tax=Parascedosporium putredinis TaxID=1442378 RepID=A0A9P1H775_9PEZI|nr:unnamed protein product [Parascedosporium putredinis]CAI7998394.1 unnamed protein product [Parascedosporium putredinis]
MGAMRTVADWRKLPLSLTELCIDTTLRCGQSFRWRKFEDEWSCTLHGRIISLKQDASHLHYRVVWPEKSSRTESLGNGPLQDDTEALLKHYFSLKVDLESLYKQWSDADPNFRKRAPQFTGVRILSQDAWETLVSFICSSNNNISRISQMVHKLCVTYGPLIGHIGDTPFHDFPKPEALLGAEVESQLRNLGFGYRAKYIAKTAQIVAGKPHDIWGKEAGWAHSVLFTADLRAFSDRNAQKAEAAIIKVKKEESANGSGKLSP